MVLSKAGLIASLQNEVRQHQRLRYLDEGGGGLEGTELRTGESRDRGPARRVCGSGLTDADFRAEVTDFDGQKTSRGAFLTNLVLNGCAAYRMQLFLYLKATSAPALNSSNLWSGVDSPTQA